jgi:hypothetical protein
VALTPDSSRHELLSLKSADLSVLSPFSVAGDVSFWEFSGYESYYVTYDRFIGDPNAVYLVVASMKDDATERMKQLDFWMNFIRTRIIPVEPIGEFINYFLVQSGDFVRTIRGSAWDAVGVAMRSM